MFSATIDIKLTGLDRFEKEIERQLQGAPGPIHDCFELWAVRYRSYLQQRFDTYSRGGGNWKPLDAKTLKARRNPKRNIPLKTAILRDTGTLFTALTPVFIGSPGALQQFVPYGIKVGYGGNQRYIDDKNHPQKATIADIAAFHNNGAMPHLPQRQIIVDPPLSLLNTMADDMSKALKNVAGGFTSR